MYDRLLVAVDHSETAGRVVNAAREMAALSNGEVWVLHVREKEVVPRAGFLMLESAEEAQSTAGGRRAGAVRRGRHLGQPGYAAHFSGSLT
jgi:nucleotide-binding universal stress UspA family protein